MNQSRLENARRESEEAGADWRRSPIALLAALILVAAAIAFVVTSLGGGDDAADTSVLAPEEPEISTPASADASQVPEPPAVPEIDTVVISGDPLPLLSDETPDPAVGTQAPSATATDLASGDTVSLEPGTARVIGFFAHWCPHCQAEIPELIAWMAANPLPANTEFVAVSTVVRSDRDNYPPSAWFEAEGWPSLVVVDDERSTLLNTYGFRGFPAFIAIDANGLVVDRLGGNVGAPGFDRLVSHFRPGSSE